MIPLQLRDESIPPPGNRLDVSGPIGGVAERIAEFVHRGIETLVVIHRRSLGPDPVLKFLTGDFFPRSLQKHRQNLEWLFGEFEGNAVLVQFFRGRRIEPISLDTSRPPALLMFGTRQRAR